MTDAIRVRTDEGVERTVDPGTVETTLTRTRIDLLRAVAREAPESVRAAARLVDRDVKNVHGDLEALWELDLVEFKWEGTRRRPVVPYDELVVTVPIQDSD